MRTARTLLLALLVLLLPLRGALAGAMVCAGHSGHAAVAVAAAAHGEAAGLHGQQMHSAHHAIGCASDAPDVDDGSVECHTCAASCSTSPLVAAVPELTSPSRFGQAPVPALDAPAASHVSDGPERPPRLT